MIPQRSQAVVITSAALCVAFLLLGSLWLLLPSPTLFAQSQPDALGTISGVVRNEQGDPLPNIRVTLYQPNFGDMRTTTTDAQGKYELLSVLPGSYPIRFIDNGKIYASTFYGNAALASDAANVTVNGNHVVGIDMQLALGGTITATLDSVIPLTGTNVSFTLFAKTSTGHWGLYDTLYWPANGSVFYGLPKGVYRLCVQPDILSNNLDLGECYDHALTTYYAPPDDATDIVMDGATQRIIAFKLGETSQLQGTVRSKKGNPLANVQLILSNVINGPQNMSVVSDAQGHFSFGRIFDGDYTLQATYPRYEYLSIFSNGTRDTAKAEHLHINSTSRYSLTLSMQQSGMITGSIRLEGGGIPNTPYMSIVAFAPAPPDHHWSEGSYCDADHCSNAFDPATGAYTMTGLTSGTYRLRADQYGSPNSITGFYGGSSLQNAADVAVVTGKSTPNINITIGSGQFEGAILGTATSNGVPIEDVVVGLYAAFTPGPYDGPPSSPPFITTTTNSQGHYHFEGLGSGYYAVSFRDPKGHYAMTFYGGSYMTLTQVIITGSMSISGVDAALAPGSIIKGHIKRGLGKNPADFQIQVIDANSFRDLYFLETVSRIDGMYELKNLPPGRYLVGASSLIYAPGSPQPRWYPNANDPFSPGAEPIQVGPGEVRTGIDFTVDLAPSAYLPTIEVTGPTPIR